MKEVTDADLQAFLNDAGYYEKTMAETKFLDFVHFAWPVLEPGMKFVSNWHIEVMCEHLEAVSRGHIRRLLCNVPPGCTKSMLFNVFFPAWEWTDPAKRSLRYISAGFNQELPTRDMVRCRTLIQSEWYQRFWPVSFADDQNQKTYYENENTGWRKSTSVGASIIGFRADRLIIDDPHSIETAESDVERETAIRWFTETLPTRLNKLDESAIMVVMQRLHSRDVSGLIIEELGDDYTHLCLPMEFEVKTRCWTNVKTNIGDPKMMRRIKTEADPLPHYVGDSLEGVLMYPQDPRTKEGEYLDPDGRFTKQSVDELKRTFRASGGTYAEAGQLQQRPVPRSGGMFKRDDFQYVDSVPAGGYTVRGWDLAATRDDKAAWTVGCKMSLGSDGCVYIEDIVRLRGTAGEVEQALQATAVQDGLGVKISIPQDPGQAGKAQVAGFAKLLHGFDFMSSVESGAKEMRASPLAAQVEAQNVYLVRGAWNDTFLAEAGLFPGSKFKDQIDAASRAYHELLKGEGDTVSLFGIKAY